ncbi:hypothetical protein K466DRAFT_591698 [Polyporus arcularius HHB13444]|uniref:Uncharacterized protein n=1 Tax=Polyporus arcularius HHB13444 TaxID=1314778 RepID=A0A5C3NTQ8_9APHY|nr:hypothetical protein K466DRAFT_591698 [Polyporus arcularius HHB13444]
MRPKEKTFAERPSPLWVAWTASAFASASHIRIDGATTRQRKPRRPTRSLPNTARDTRVSEDRARGLRFGSDGHTPTGGVVSWQWHAWTRYARRRSTSIVSHCHAPDQSPASVGKVALAGAQSMSLKSSPPEKSGLRGFAPAARLATRPLASLGQDRRPLSKRPSHTDPMTQDQSSLACRSVPTSDEIARGELLLPVVVRHFFEKMLGSRVRRLPMLLQIEPFRHHRPFLQPSCGCTTVVICALLGPIP